MSVYADSIDDNDPQVLYSPGWVLVTQDGSWTGTMHSTTNIGASASVRFIGSRVAVVCTIPTGSGSLVLGSVSLDGGPAVNVSYVTTPAVQWQTVIWDSGPLLLASHLLVITNTGNQAYFRLDDIDYDPTNGNSPHSSSQPPASTASVTTTVVDQARQTSPMMSTTSSSSSSGSLSTNVTVSTQPIFGIPSTSITQSLSSSPSSSSSGSDLNSGAGSSTASTKLCTTSIVAGILGALLAILLVVALLIFIRRRRNRVHYPDNSAAAPFSCRHDTAARKTIPTPFNLDMTPAEMSTSNLVTVRRASYSNTYNSFGQSGLTQEGNYTRRSASPTPTDANSSASGSGSGVRHSIPTSSSMPTSEELHAVSGRMPPPTLHQGVGWWTVGGGGVGSKHAEAFGQATQRVDTSTSEYGDTSRTTFQDAPPAYTGRVSSFLGPSLGEGVES